MNHQAEELKMDVLIPGGRVRAGMHGSLHPIYGKTHKYLFPPSANWYCSKICDWGQSDVFGVLFAFGAKNSVFIYQVIENQEVHEAAAVSGSRVKVSFFAQVVRGKRDRRVTAIQFLMDTTGMLRLICGGEEGSVQIWDVASLTMIEQHRKHKVEVTAVTASAMLDANFVVTGDRQGQISAWERDVGKVSVFMPISGDGIHSMAISPYDKALIAVGFRSGVLCLVDATKGTVRHRLAGHDQEVQCVAWKLTVRNRFAGERLINSPDQEVWLASSSRDKTIKVWKVSMSGAKDPELDQVLRLPTGKQGMSYTQAKQLWLPIAWSLNSLQKTVDKHSLWSGSFDGSLLRWEWNVATMDAQRKEGKNRRTTCKPVVVKGGHSRMLFCIAMVPPRGSGTDANEAVSMLTVSLDRELRLWKENLSSKPSAATCVEKLSGLGGHVYSVSYNAATGLVAAGIGDQTIRLWQLGMNASCVTSAYQCDLLWKGLQSKITCVQWHPFRQSLLAYGMEDGRIGVYDVQTKTYTHFRTSHDEEVQQLRWIVRKPKNADGSDKGDNSFLAIIKQLEAAQAKGQCLESALVAQENQTRRCDEDDLKVFLWSCDTGGALLESNADVVDQKSRNITLHNVAFEWDEQCELVAIGRANGIVEVMRWEEGAYDNSTVVHRFHEHLTSVTCLAWGKGTDASLLASGGQDGKIFIYSCKMATTCTTQATAIKVGEVVQERRLLGSLAGHSNKILALRWWSSDESQSFLASSSADGTVQVWNLASFQREAYFNYHVGRVLSLDWVLPYTLVTGGEDQTLRFWDFKEQQKEALPRLKKHGKVKQPHEVDTLSTSPLADHTSVEIQSGDTTSSKASQELLLTGNCNAKLVANKAPKKKRMLLFHSKTKLTPTEIASACCSVAGVKSKASGTMPAKDADEPIGNLLAHTDRASLRGFFTSECHRFQEKREWESLANTLLIQGNITEALRIVAREGALTPTWLSYAPVAGMNVWREMTNLYAHQVDAQGDKIAAAFHFLSIAKVRSAVACLVSADAYKEALALIRSRLGPCDPLLHDTLWKYADFLGVRGCHAEAALALLNIGSVKAKTRAVHTLVSTGDMIYVESALDVLLAALESQEKVAEEYEADHQNDVEKLSFPASFFISIASQALVKARLDIAETAGYLLQSCLAGASSSASHRLTWCLLGMLKSLDEHQLAHYVINEADDEVVAERVDILLQSDSPESVREFFEFLTQPRVNENDGDGDGDGGDRLYDLIVEEYAFSNLEKGKQCKQWLLDRADHFWYQVLSVCRRCGYWFDTEGDVHIQEAQDVLLEASCFSEIEKAAAISAREAQDDSTISSLLQVGQKLLRFVMDVMSTSFIGALEHMREIFLLLAQDKIVTSTRDTNAISLISQRASYPIASAECLDMMLLLYPGSFASPEKLPQCGELAEEQLDTLVLWSSVLLSQCKLFVASLTPIAKKNKRTDVESLIQSLLHRLRFWFLHDKVTTLFSQSLMNAGIQLQLRMVLNEVLVAIFRPTTSQEEDGRCDADGRQAEQKEAASEYMSKKQALIDDVEDIRSRLTWSDGWQNARLAKHP
ncbi:unnamed protein product [Peronospora farinosa]|uniref:Anaphase-promoting complex subunit 4 WD40 domain-containing protein n=1 Tax=Peronospora farinosa TaxID=134698 RepID=A0ABN8CH44_9STRA|nr:unnamed protein product [Peronospora farinosa]